VPWWAWRRVKYDRNFLGLWFMLPAAAFLLLFLTYPLGLGIWLSFTDARIGRPGSFVGIDNFDWLAGDSVFWLSVFNTFLYTIVASVFKFGLGLYLALLLNNHMPFKAFIRAIVLLPFIVPTVLSAIAFWWIYDPQFSIISWTLVQFGLIDQYINFLGEPNNARASVIVANVWRGIPFVAITLIPWSRATAPIETSRRSAFSSPACGPAAVTIVPSTKTSVPNTSASAPAANPASWRQRRGKLTPAWRVGRYGKA
jgi:multiple sugar transport system permease protein